MFEGKELGRIFRLALEDKMNNVTRPRHIIHFIYVYSTICFVCSSLATMFHPMMA
jgi:hypothetical protein